MAYLKNGKLVVIDRPITTDWENSISFDDCPEFVQISYASSITYAIDIDGYLWAVSANQGLKFENIPRLIYVQTLGQYNLMAITEDNLPAKIKITIYLDWQKHFGGAEITILGISDAVGICSNFILDVNGVAYSTGEPLENIVSVADLRRTSIAIDKEGKIFTRKEVHILDKPIGVYPGAILTSSGKIRTDSIDSTYLFAIKNPENVEFLYAFRGMHILVLYKDGLLKIYDVIGNTISSDSDVDLISDQPMARKRELKSANKLMG